MERVQIIFKGKTHDIDEDGDTIEDGEMLFTQEAFDNIGMEHGDEYRVSIEQFIDFTYHELEEAQGV